MDLPHLRDLRRRAVMSQEQLAEKSGVARDTISKLEGGHRRAYPSTIRKLAAGLDLEPQVLLGGTTTESGRREKSPENAEAEGDRRIGF